MGLKVQDLLIIAAKKLPYVAPTAEVRALEPLLTMKQLTGDVIQSNGVTTSVADLIKSSRKILGRDLNIVELSKVVDVEHALPSSSWNGTVNIVNEALRGQGFVGKDLIKKLDDLMQSAKKTQFDAIAYRGEAYSENNKHLAKIMNLKPGEKFTDNTYRYITGNVNYADNFDFGSVKVKYNYILPEGSICIGTCEDNCALLPKETYSEIISIDKSDPLNLIINAILRTQ